MAHQEQHDFQRMMQAAGYHTANTAVMDYTRQTSAALVNLVMVLTLVKSIMTTHIESKAHLMAAPFKMLQNLQAAKANILALQQKVTTIN